MEKIEVKFSGIHSEGGIERRVTALTFEEFNRDFPHLTHFTEDNHVYEMSITGDEFSYNFTKKDEADIVELEEYPRSFEDTFDEDFGAPYEYEE